MLQRAGALSCHALNFAGAVPNACYNADGVSLVGMIAAFAVFGLVSFIAWRQYL